MIRVSKQISECLERGSGIIRDVFVSLCFNLEDSRGVVMDGVFLSHANVMLINQGVTF